MTKANMRTRITWCVVGFILSWVTWATVHHFRERPRDYTQWHPASKSDLAPDWMKDAYARTLGHFVLFSSADSSKTSAWIYPSSARFPSVTFLDDDYDGCVDNIQVLDSSGRCFYINDSDGDGEFDSWRYAPEIASDIMFFSDGDMDGHYDYRIGPGDERAVKIDFQWYDLVFRDGTSYLDINGILTEVKQVDNLWRIVEEKSGEEKSE
ncbi:MAG: hypothetical protein IH898_00315 [Planctomycetes bacterium]|nr:hypothetical protein [Planctomycetota bacterium]